MVPPVRFELTTYGLQIRCSTPELERRYDGALASSYPNFRMEAQTGFEPAFLSETMDLQSSALPLGHRAPFGKSCVYAQILEDCRIRKAGGFMRRFEERSLLESGSAVSTKSAPCVDEGCSAIARGAG